MTLKFRSIIGTSSDDSILYTNMDKNVWMCMIFTLLCATLHECWNVYKSFFVLHFMVIWTFTDIFYVLLYGKYNHPSQADTFSPFPPSLSQVRICPALFTFLLSIYLCIYISISLSIYVSIYLPIYLSVYLHTIRFVFIYISSFFQITYLNFLILVNIYIDLIL